jgi:hypothetical protein
MRQVSQTEQVSFAVFKHLIAPLHVLRQLLHEDVEAPRHKRALEHSIDLVFANRYTVDPQALLFACLDIVNQNESFDIEGKSDIWAVA